MKIRDHPIACRLNKQECQTLKSTLQHEQRRILRATKVGNKFLKSFLASLLFLETKWEGHYYRDANVKYGHCMDDITCKERKLLYWDHGAPQGGLVAIEKITRLKLLKTQPALTLNKASRDYFLFAVEVGFIQPLIKTIKE